MYMDFDFHVQNFTEDTQLHQNWIPFFENSNHNGDLTTLL